MRAAGRVGRTVVLRLRFDDFSRATRSHTLPGPTARTAAILATAPGLLATAQPLIEHRGLTLVGVAVSNLDNGTNLQLPLPFAGRDDDALDAVLDEVRDRFGTTALTRAILLGRDPAWRCRCCPTESLRSAAAGATLVELGALAQLGERRLCKPKVTGSIPVRSIGKSLQIALMRWPLGRRREHAAKNFC